MNSCFFMDILVVYNNHICNTLINSLLSAYVLRVR